MCNVDVPVAHLSSPCLPEPIEGPRDGYSLGTMIGAQLPLFGGPQGYGCERVRDFSDRFRDRVLRSSYADIHSLGPSGALMELSAAVNTGTQPGC